MAHSLVKNTRADSDMHGSPWLNNDDDASLAHSRCADGNCDNALNSSLRHVSMHERDASSV